MKNSNIFLTGLLVAAVSLSACDDDKQLTLDAPEVKLMEEIKLEVSEVLPLPVGMDTTITYTCGPETADDLTVIFSSTRTAQSAASNPARPLSPPRTPSASKSTTPWHRYR